MRCPALARADWPGPGRHPGHPTAKGGLPASKPGLRAGTRDLSEGSVTHARVSIFEASVSLGGLRGRLARTAHRRAPTDGTDTSPKPDHQTSAHRRWLRARARRTIMIGHSPAWAESIWAGSSHSPPPTPGAEYALVPAAPNKTLSVFPYDTQVKHEECEKDVLHDEPCGSPREGAGYDRRHDGPVCPNAEPIE